MQSPALNVMVAAARKAGRSLARDFGEVENLQVSIKGPGDFVSAADMRAERVVREELMAARPAYGWLGEESEPVVGKDPTRRWIVDPLDGTTNFLHGLPHFAISIALEHKGQLIAGVIYDPIKDELFTAEKGGGAFVNDRRLRVSARSEMSEGLFATGVPFGAKTTLSRTLGDLVRLMPRTAGVRRLGSAALDLAYVAAGRYDGFWEREIQAWDMAAGLVIAREAGALVADLAGGQDMLTRGEVIAANGALFKPFAALIEGEGREYAGPLGRGAGEVDADAREAELVAEAEAAAAVDPPGADASPPQASPPQASPPQASPPQASPSDAPASQASPPQASPPQASPPQASPSDAPASHAAAVDAPTDRSN